LLHARHVNFTHLQTWPPAPQGDDATSLLQLADPPNAVDLLLLRYAALAAFGLGADRYHDGGWGFSLGHFFDFDEYDGDELPRGRYDLDVIVLGALSEFLGDAGMIDEWEAIFADCELGRQPKIVAEDRLPILAGLLACLASQGRLGADMREAPLKETLRQLERNLADQRWVLPDQKTGEENFDYGAILLACLDQLTGAVEHFVGPVRRRLEEEGNARLIEQSKDAAETAVIQGLRKHNLFANALQASKRALMPAEETTGVPREDLHLAVLSLLLTFSDVGLSELNDRLERRKGKLWILNNFDELHANFAILSQASNPDPHCLNLLFCCAAVLAGNQVRLLEERNKFEALIIAFLERDDAVPQLYKMNLIGWVSLLLFAQRTCTRRLDPSLLEFMWLQGRSLRAERNRVIDAVSDVAAIRNAIRERLAAVTRSAFVGWSKRAQLNAGGVKDEEKRFESFINGVMSASFWGPPLAREETSESTQSSSFLTGVLRVQARTMRVELETPGYNQMFLHPFSEITGMNVSNLRSLRREFGDMDGTLVRLMGETVVKECYERFGGEFIESSRSFEERTQFITEQLTGENWDATKGFDDFLVVKKGEKGERWVYRTALIQSRTEGLGDVRQDQVISWRFVEMPPAVGSMITKGERVKKFPHDRRS
jgi:hypothetical protein